MNKDINWNPDTIKELYKCSWISGFKIKKYNNVKEEEMYYMSLFRKLIQTLPPSEVEKLKRSTGKLNIKRDRKRFYFLIITYMQSMDNRLRKFMQNKSNYIDNLINSLPTQIDKSYIPTDISFVQYRQRQKLNQQSGYLHPMSLRIYAPIEILEYAGFKLTKYDKIRDNYYVMIEHPDELDIEPMILYDKDPISVENKAESIFENKIDEYLKTKSNPYGDKTFASVDISNVESVMNQNNEDPLDLDIF